MRPAIRITWLPAQICGAIAEEFSQLVSVWAAAWDLPEPEAVRSAPVSVSIPVALDVVDLLAELPAPWKQSIGRALFKFDSAGSPLVQAVVKRAVESLQSSLREAFSVEEASDAETPSALGDQGIQVSLEILGLRCGLLLSCGQLFGSGRLQLPKSEALPAVNFERALANAPVSLVAELGRADVGFEELMQLAPGDVLLLKQTLDTPLRVRSPGSLLELRAHLGAAAGLPKRAVRCLAS